jgi:hypothetical protein
MTWSRFCWRVMDVVGLLTLVGLMLSLFAFAFLILASTIEAILRS